MPGLIAIKSTFPKDLYPSYNDHWVSNIFDRVKFIETLGSVLDFNPKVDFNAGVIAAGEAIIDSTVIGNTPQVVLETKQDALVDQSQIFLPLNHALSENGHVYLFLKEIGQGIQHIASRVDNLVGFVERANDYRNLTGEGFSFLRIPRSYYGRLSDKALLKCGLTQEKAEQVLQKLAQAGLMDTKGIVKMDITDQELENLSLEFPNKNEVITTIKRSRYINMYTLLKEKLPESEYLKIAKNQVLVDIQGGDILYQIFTANILQDNPNDEAPFLEFIQRTCQSVDVRGNKKTLQAGCGGFGIRNFLTLFLSIEVTRAMDLLEKATKEGNQKEIEFAKNKIDIFTHQLEVSNPILTQISDAMTEEGRAREELESCSEAEKEKIQKRISDSKKQKENGQNELMKISDDHKAQMAKIREEFEAN